MSEPMNYLSMTNPEGEPGPLQCAKTAAAGGRPH
jgi:hypothetical protein